MTMIFDDIELWGEVAEFAVNPPIIVLEVFDQDAGVSTQDLSDELQILNIIWISGLTN